MRIVDSHCHAAPVWYEPVETLLAQMDRHGVAHAVLIQMMGQLDNDYQFDCLRRYPGRFASVVIVDPRREDATEHLTRLAGDGASGVRLQPTTRSPGAEPLAIWRAAARLGLTVSCIGAADEFADPAFAAIVQELPDLAVVIEHLGSLGRPRGEPLPPDVADAVFDLSRFANVAMKVTGLGEYCVRALPVTQPFPFRTPIPDLLERAYRAFGANRLMWGSDFPPVSSREGYGNALVWPLERLAHRPVQEQEAIFGETALARFPVR